jgi:hypothetical protein
MDVKSLRNVLGKIGTTLDAASAQEAKAAIADLNAALESREHDSVEQVVRDLAPAPTDFVAELKMAGRDEAAFKRVMFKISESKLKKAEIQAIVKAHVGRYDTKSSARDLLDRLNLHFYEQMYEDASHKLAARATPW